MLIRNGISYYPSMSVANTLGVGRNNFLKRLRQLRILDSDNIPTRPNPKYYAVEEVENNGYKKWTTYYSREFTEAIKKHVTDLPATKLSAKANLDMVQKI